MLAAAALLQSRERWRAAGRSHFGAPVADDGAVYCGNFDHSIYAFEAGSGRRLWSFDTESHAAGSPVVGAHTVYAASRSCRLFYLDPGTGSEKRPPIDVGPVVDGPVLAGDRVSVANLAGEIRAFDAQSGEPAWTYSQKDPHDPGYCVGPVAGRDGEVFGLLASGWIAALDAGTGTSRWRVRPGGALYTPGAVASDGTLLVLDLPGTLHALDPRTGAVRWRQSLGEPGDLAPVEAGGVVAVATRKGRLAAFDLQEGRPLWQLSMEVPAGLSAGQGSFVVVGSKGEVTGLDPLTGSKQWSDRVPGRPLAAALSRHGLLLAFEGAVAALRPGAIQEAFPQEAAPRIRREAHQVPVGYVRLPERDSLA